jgi:hypothetical protein
VGCQWPERRGPLAHTVESPDVLGRELLNALSRRDRARLDELALNEDEFRAVVWPRLPASRPERALPFEYVWGDLHQKSIAYLGATVGGLGGQPLEFVGIRFLGDTTDYDEFRVHRDSILDVRTEAGDTTQVRVFGSMIEYAGRVKVFSYVVD